MKKKARSLRSTAQPHSLSRGGGIGFPIVGIDASKTADGEVIYARDFAEAIIGTIRDPFLILDGEMRVHKANEAFYAAFKVTPVETVGRTVFELDYGQWNIPALRKLLVDILPRASTFNDFEVTHHFKKIGRRTLLLNARTLTQDAGHHGKILLGIQDVTERLAFQAELRESEARYRTLFSSMDQGFCIIEMIFDKKQKPVDWIFLEVNPAFARQTGLQAVAGKQVRDLIPDHEEFWFETYGKVARTGKPIRFVHEAKVLGRWFDLYAFRVGAVGSRKVAVLFSDVTARNRAEAALRDIRTQLADHAGQLERTVGLRTAQLTATNRRLETSVATITKAREEYRSLLQESQFMQKKLRHLARQILTAQEDERRHISRELHDEVVQTLVGINVELAALGTAANLGARPLRAKIVRTQRLVEKSVNAVHQFARELRPAVLDDLGLIPALHAYMKIVAARQKFKISLTAFTGVESLDSARRTVLYRVAQEALTNVGRHAQASLVNVSITKIAGAVRMEVRDNGKSFPVLQTLSAKTNKRLGLLGMRERVEMVGGTVVIESAPGQGTTVRAEIPFNSKSIS